MYCAWQLENRHYYDFSAWVQNEDARYMEAEVEVQDAALGAHASAEKNLCGGFLILKVKVQAEVGV